MLCQMEQFFSAGEFLEHNPAVEGVGGTKHSVISNCLFYQAGLRSV